MKLIQLLLLIFTLSLVSCKSKNNDLVSTEIYPDVKVVSAMKNVMWKGQLHGTINLDTIQNKKGLYGIGPESYLTGELLINNGKSFVSRVTSDSTMVIEKTFNTSAPFFVYANVNEWNEIELPSNIKTIKDLETFIDTESKSMKRPFAFKLTGIVSNAIIHVQNLPKGTKVSSPDEAHQGQTNYYLSNEEVEIVGFFSTEHKGIFTHHDSFLHMHLITKDETKMGHLDEVEINKMTLFFPKN